MLKRIVYRYGLPLIALIMLGFTAMSLMQQSPRTLAAPAHAVAATPFAATVAGIGLIEPQSESIDIGPHIPGIVSRLHAQAGDRVRAGDPLLTIDDREARAQCERLARELEVAKARLADERDELQRAERLKAGVAIGEGDLARRRFAFQTRAAEVKVAEAALAESETTLERLTVRAPIDGTVLRVNIRPGEYAAAGGEALMVLGEDRILHVRVEIDERLVQRVRPEARAVASLRGEPGRRVDLAFVRFEPQILAKRQLSGDRAEQVDTRVLEAIYAFDPKALPAFVGQQMDVFIEAGVPRS